MMKYIYSTREKNKDNSNATLELHILRVPIETSAQVTLNEHLIGVPLMYPCKWQLKNL